MHLLRSWLQRYFAPPAWLSEIWFGVMMALTLLVGSASSVAEEDGEGTREMLSYLLGGNFSWGVICGVMFIVDAMFERGRIGLWVSKVQTAASADEAVAAIRGEFSDATFQMVTSPAMREELYRDMLRNVQSIQPPKTRMHWADLGGGLINVLLVFLPVIPAVAPFLVFGNTLLALCTAYVLLVGMLFFIGYRWACETNANRWLSGLLMLLVGCPLVLFAEFLGG